MGYYTNLTKTPNITLSHISDSGVGDASAASNSGAMKKGQPWRLLRGAGAGAGAAAGEGATVAAGARLPHTKLSNPCDVTTVPLVLPLAEGVLAPLLLLLPPQIKTLVTSN